MRRAQLSSASVNISIKIHKSDAFQNKTSISSVKRVLGTGFIFCSINGNYTQMFTLEISVFIESTAH